MYSSDSLHHLNHSFSFVFSLLSNSLMCLCILKEKNLQIRQYSYVLVIQCLADVLSAFCFFLVSPRIIMVEGQLVFVVTGILCNIKAVPVFGSNLDFKYLAFSTYPFAMLMVLLCIPISFWFRYNLICR